MWFEFALAFILGFLILYIPGFILLRAIRFDLGFSSLFAPVVSISLLALLTTVYEVLHIPCNAISVLGIPTLLLVFFLLLSRRYCFSKKSVEVEALSLSKQDAITLGLYILVGLILCIAFFIKQLDGPNSFYNRVDNVTHINLIQAFIESGIWSSFTTSNYLSASVTPLEYSGSFYPSGWHYIVALIVQILQTSIPLGINATNAIFISIVYPSSIFFLLRCLFKEDRLLIVVGSVIALAFTAFPWGFFLKGPLYPNLASFCLMPLVIAAFMLFINKKLWKTSLAQFLVVAFMAFIALALVQTNALFSCLVFFTCFLASCLYKQSFSFSVFRNRKILAPACLVFGAAIVWLICFKLPFLQSVIAYDWKSDLSLVNALFNLGSLALTASVPQLLLVALIPFGLIYLASKRIVWLLFPALFMAIAYLECRCGSGFIKHLFAGFWYTDSSRLAANLAIFLVPIATAGLRLIISLLQTLVKQALNTLNLAVSSSLITAVAVISFVAINFFPSYTYLKSSQIIQTPFGIVHQQMKNIFDTSREQVYSSEEQEFVEKVLSVIPEGSLVVNQPNDGSVFSYGINELNSYYRFIIREYGIPSNETPESELIRTSLCNYVTDKEVQQAVQSIGAKYVLLLDQGKKWDDMPKLPQSTEPDNWIGIDNIDDSTPGFKVVLAEGDMRLYEIESL